MLNLFPSIAIQPDPLYTLKLFSWALIIGDRITLGMLQWYSKSLWWRQILLFIVSFHGSKTWTDSIINHNLWCMILHLYLKNNHRDLNSQGSMMLPNAKKTVTHSRKPKWLLAESNSVKSWRHLMLHWKKLRTNKWFISRQVYQLIWVGKEETVLFLRRLTFYWTVDVLCWKQNISTVSMWNT